MISATPPGDDLTAGQLRDLVATLRDEITRLKEELRRARRDQHEVPPHYL